MEKNMGGGAVPAKENFVWTSISSLLGWEIYFNLFVSLKMPPAPGFL